MLKPYVCVACEKVILDHQPEMPTGQVGPASLINLFSKMIGQLAPGSTEVPKNAVVPKEWVVYSAWDIEPGDEKKEYMLCTQMLYPDKTPFGETYRVKINMAPAKRSQMTIRFQGFPVGQPGFYTVQTWIEENSKQVVAPIEFRIELEMKPMEPLNQP